MSACDQRGRFTSARASRKPASGCSSQQRPAIRLQYEWVLRPGQSDQSVADVRRTHVRTRLRAPGTTVRRARARQQGQGRHEQAPHDGDCHWAPKDAASQWNHTEDGGKCREQHRPRESGNSASIADGLILRQHLSGMQRQNRWDPANSRRILSREIVIGPLYTKTSKERQLWMWRWGFCSDRFDTSGTHSTWRFWRRLLTRRGTRSKETILLSTLTAMKP